MEVVRVMPTTYDGSADALREQVRQRYAGAALAVTAGAGTQGCCGEAASASCCGGETSAASCCGDAAGAFETDFGAELYSPEQRSTLPTAALAASLGCGNPLAVAELRAG